MLNFRWSLLLFLIWCPLLWAQNLLVAWAPGQQQEILELPASDPLPQAITEGRLLRSSSRFDYDLYLYKVADRSQRLRLMHQLRAHPDVIYVELDSAVAIQSEGQPRHFDLLGYPLGAGWPPLQFKCDDYPIAVIDTGISESHPGLASLEFIVSENRLSPGQSARDINGHGTHLAGLIGALPNANAAVAGLCSSARILNYKFLDHRGQGAISEAVFAINDAIASGAAIINASWTYPGFSQSLKDVIAEADASGVYVVAAAGNEGQNLDDQAAYPAAFSQEFHHVIAVANAVSFNELNTQPAAASNYGVQSTDFAAPGTAVVSTGLFGSYVAKTGTSMSAPLVSATLSALMQKYPGQSSSAYRAALIHTLNRQGALFLDSLLRFPGVLDSYAALKLPAETIFRPAWFNYQWDPSQLTLHLQGYQLDSIARVQVQGLDGSQVDARVLQQTADLLSIQLPVGSDAGIVFFEVDSYDEALFPVDLSRTQPSAQPSFVQRCQGSVCDVVWQGIPLQVTREDYKANDQGYWFVSSAREADQEYLLIQAEDFSDSWSFSLESSGRAHFVGMDYKNNQSQWIPLTRKDGYLQQNNRHANWVISNPSGQPYAKPLSPGLYQIALKPEISVSSASSCFIATQVYGDSQAPEVEILRSLRSDLLMKSAFGRKLVDYYYQYSPGLVEWMDDKPWAQGLARKLLNIVVWIWASYSASDELLV